MVSGTSYARYHFFKPLLFAVLIFALAGCVAMERNSCELLPPPERMLFWSPDQQAIGFKSFDRLYASRVVEHGAVTRALPVDPPIEDIPRDWAAPAARASSFYCASALKSFLALHGALRRAGPRPRSAPPAD